MNQNWRKVQSNLHLETMKNNNLHKDIEQMKSLNHDEFLWVFSGTETTVIPLYLGYPGSALESVASSVSVVYRVKKTQFKRITLAEAKSLLEVPPKVVVQQGATIREALLSIRRMLEKSPVTAESVDFRSLSSTKKLELIKSKLARSGKIKMLRFIEDTMNVVS